MGEDKNYKEYINGLKGFACLIVMIGHFVGIYKYAEYFPIQVSILDMFFNSKFDFLFDETFWVILFFVVSGYLVAMSQIKDIKQLLKKCIQRFVRLGLPVFFASCLIWIVQESIGFYTSETANLFVNTWIQRNYLQEITFLDIVLAPVNVLIFNRVELNSPYWMLRDIFFSSILIYTLTYIKNHFENKKYIVYLCCVVTVIGSFLISRIMCACIAGMFLLWFEKDYRKIIKEEWFAYVIIAGTMSLYIIARAYISFLFWATLIVFIPKAKVMYKIFTSKIAIFFGKISFGIYSFHWPVLCSMGMFIVLKMADKWGVFSACMYALILSSIVTMIIAVIFHMTFEKLSSKIIRKIF